MKEPEGHVSFRLFLGIFFGFIGNPA